MLAVRSLHARLRHSSGGRKFGVSGARLTVTAVWLGSVSSVTEIWALNWYVRAGQPPIGNILRTMSSKNRRHVTMVWVSGPAILRCLGSGGGRIDDRTALNTCEADGRQTPRAPASGAWSSCSPIAPDAGTPWRSGSSAVRISRLTTRAMMGVPSDFDGPVERIQPPGPGARARGGKPPAATRATGAHAVASRRRVAAAASFVLPFRSRPRPTRPSSAVSEAATSRGGPAREDDGSHVRSGLAVVLRAGRAPSGRRLDPFAGLFPGPRRSLRSTAWRDGGRAAVRGSSERVGGG